MINDAIKKIFKQDETQIDCLVVHRKSVGIWVVRDIIGREMTVRSDEVWRPAVDWVTVQSGRIVSKTKSRDGVQRFNI